MSRSKRKPNFKDRGLRTEEYWRKVRRHQKNDMRSDKFMEDEEIDHPKQIVNDYDKCDYVCVPDQMFGMSKTNKKRIDWEKLYRRK